MKLFYTLCILFFTHAVSAQINKGQFLVGGNGTHSTNNFMLNESKYRAVEIDGRGGFFLLNKLAAGIQFGYNYSKQFGSDLPNNNYFDRSISAGPFVRYYFLGTNNKFNLLADASYSHIWLKNGHSSGHQQWNRSGYTLAGGPVFFLNPKVSLETTLNYEYNYKSYVPETLRINVGFHIHLSNIKTKTSKE